VADSSLAVLITVLTLVAVLATSGAAKVRDPRATRDAFDALRVPAVVPADAAATALPWSELALATLLLVAPTGWLVPVAAALVLLMLVYTWIIARALGFAEPVTCSCFGSVGRHDVDVVTLARNVLLTLMAVLTLWFATAGGSVPAAVGDLAAREWWALVATAAAVVVGLLVSGRSSAAPSAPSHGVDVLEYDRQRIPYAALVLPDDTTASLAELARTQARLLVILNDGCSPCVRTAAKLDDWAARLSPVVRLHAVYSTGSGAAGATGHDPGLSAWEQEYSVRRVFDVTTPAAVLLGADGFLAGGPVVGEDDVHDFVTDVLDELGMSHDIPS
jgi:hypothetical protein